MSVKIRSTTLQRIVAVLLVSAIPAQALAEPAWPVVMRERMSRVANVAWRLSGAADTLCKTHSARTGLLVDYIGAYEVADRPAISELLGLGTLPQIAAVVPGSAADKAGLKPGDEILAINDEAVSAIQAHSKDPDLLADEVEGALAATPPGTVLHLTIKRRDTQSTVSLVPDQGCSPRFIVTMGKGVTAFSDPSNVALDSDLVAFARTDDELALIAGHELAHIVNQDALTKGMPQRAKEDRADVVGARIARCAGYNLEAALGFWPRFQQHDWLRFLRLPTHGSAQARVASIRANAMEGPCPPSPEFSSPTLRGR